MPKIINTDAIDSNAKVLDRLKVLSQALAEGGLRELSVFNMAYWVVTKAIADGLAMDSFSNPNVIEDFTVCFARYYFEAVNGLAIVDEGVPVAWTKIISKNKPLSPSIALLMGANAHINHDLPLALLETISASSTRDFLPDLIKIDRLLIACGREILDSYEESNKFLRFLKCHCQWLYFRPIMSMIRFWRIMALYNFRFMQKSRTKKDGFKNRSIKIANRFLWLTEIARSLNILL